MFDDTNQQPSPQPASSGSQAFLGSPQPKDMFDELDKGAVGAVNFPTPAQPRGAASASGGAGFERPSALDSGLIKPIQPSASGPQQDMSTPSDTGSGMYEEADLKEPFLKRWKWILFGILIVVLITLAVYIFYRKINEGAPNAPTTTQEPATTPSSDEPAPPPANSPFDDDVVAPPPTVLPEAPKDTDQDGLTDVEEVELGTDPLKPDSDEDGLTDKEEVLLWRTDPRNSDSDGDTYLDGEEVSNGYRPDGPGRLFE